MQVKGEARRLEEKADALRQTAQADRLEEQRLNQLEGLMGEFGIREMFEEIMEGEGLVGAKIKTFLDSDLENAFLILRWPGKKQSVTGLEPRVIAPPELGHYSIRAGYNFIDGSLVIGGKTQNLKKTGSVSELDTEEIERAVATAYLYPDWRSSTTIQLATETV